MKMIRCWIGDIFGVVFFALSEVTESQLTKVYLILSILSVLYSFIKKSEMFKKRQQNTAIAIDEKPAVITLEKGFFGDEQERKLADYIKKLYAPKNKFLLLVWGPVVTMAVRLLDNIVLNLLPVNVREKIQPELMQFVNDL